MYQLVPLWATGAILPHLEQWCFFVQIGDGVHPQKSSAGSQNRKIKTYTIVIYWKWEVRSLTINAQASHFHPELPHLCSRSEVSGHLVGHKVEIKWIPVPRSYPCVQVHLISSSWGGGEVAGWSGVRGGNGRLQIQLSSVHFCWDAFPKSCRTEEGRTCSYFFWNSLFLFNQITIVSFDTFHLILLFFLVKSFDEGFEFLLDFANFLCKKHMNRLIFKLKITKQHWHESTKISEK